MTWIMGNPVGPSGPLRARIMIVGEAPGAEEEKEGRPFVGNAGKTLRKFLMEVGIDPEECWLTNICRIRPPGNKIVEFFDAGMPNAAILDGLEQLQRQIATVLPNVIIACGNYPLWALTGKAHWSEGKPDKPGSRGYKGITDWRGSTLPCIMAPAIKVVPTFHPSYILQEGMKDHVAFKSDLARAKEESTYPEIRRPPRQVIVDPQGSDRMAVRDWLLDDPSKTLTFDIEYLKRKDGRPNLLCVGMTTQRDKAAIIVTRNPNDVQFVRSVLCSGIGLNAQNSMFDCGILDWHHGMDIMPAIVFDTMLCQHSANIEHPKALDYLSSIYCEWHEQWKYMVKWPDIAKGKQPVSDVWEYNGIDVWRQHEIMEEQIKYELTDPAVRRTFEFEMQLLVPLWEMSKRGVYINQDKIDAIRKQCDEQIVDGMILLMETFGREINVASTPQMRDVLYKQLGLPVLKTTPTGPSCDDKVLAELALHANHIVQKVVIQTVRQVRRARNLKSKFTDIERGEDGRMRGLYNPARTDTGRLASSKFHPTDEGGNQQNFPRDKRVRDCFEPDEGMEFGYADLERAESLVVAEITGDEEMLAAHAPGVDAHRRLASALFHKAQEEIDDDERYLGKKTRHAGNYMQGPRTFMLNVNQEADKTGVSITFHEAKEYIDVYRSMHRGLKPWWRQVEAELWRSRTLFNLLGRRRVFHDHIGSIVPNAVAFVPQSTVGDVLNVGLLGVSGTECQYARRMGISGGIREHAATLREYDFQLLLQVHDAIGFQYRAGAGHIVLPLIRHLLTVPLINPRTKEEFIIPVEIQVGQSWGKVQLWQETKLAA